MYSSWYNRHIFIKITWSFLGLPYIWGGDDPMRGFDCSGLVNEGLKSVGKLPIVGDWTANQLSKMFPPIPNPKRGALVFFGRSHNITHVGICLNDRLMIEAGGGGRDNDDIEDAIARNAYVRIRPIKSRSDVVMFTDPFKK